MTEPVDNFDELAGLLKTSFPDQRCLRCGHDKFYLFPDAETPFGKSGSGRELAEGPLSDKTTPVVTLACERCGHIEQHLTGLLRRTSKPIIMEKPNV